jgi:hypothetical protein
MSQFLLQWIDLIWLPITWFAVHREHRFYAMGYICACLFSLRLQKELLDSMDVPGGITGWIAMDPALRGLIIYGGFIVFFLITSYYSKGTGGVIYMAAALSLFVISFAVSMIAMAI